MNIPIQSFCLRDVPTRDRHPRKSLRKWGAIFTYIREYSETHRRFTPADLVLISYVQARANCAYLARIHELRVVKRYATKLGIPTVYQRA